MKESQENKKAKILNAASQCFARYGYEKTTMDDIGRMVGLNKASLYYYYTNKEAIFTEVIFLEREKYIASLQERVNLENSIRKKISSYMIGRYRFIFEYLNLHNLSSESLNRMQSFFYGLYQTVVDREINFVKELIDQGVDEQQMRSCDSTRIAANIITIGDAIKQRDCNCDELRKGNGHADEKTEDEIAFICSLILDGIMR